MEYSDFAGKKVLIMGLGLNGGGLESARFFYKAGSRVTITDLQSDKTLKTTIDKLNDCPGIIYHLGGHQKADFANTDLVIKNPGVPPTSEFLLIAKEHNIPVLSDLEVFLNLAKPGRLIGITGTKGKSTTSTFISQILSSLDQENILVGNIGKSPLNTLGKEDQKIVIIELSSFQIDDLGEEKEYFDVVVFTNIFPDHLNRYGTFEKYKKSKLRLLKYLKNTGQVVHPENFSLPKLSKLQSSKQFANEFNFPMENDTIQNRLNFNAAVIAVSLLTQKDPLEIIPQITTLSPPRFRNQTVRKLNGINFINDSTATNPTVTVKTLENYPSANSIVILGGSDKNLTVDELADFINTKNFSVAILKTPVGDRLSELVKPDLIICQTDSFYEAISLSYKYLSTLNGEKFLILSPAAASFGMFLNEFDRGEQFDEIVSKLS